MWQNYTTDCTFAFSGSAVNATVLTTLGLGNWGLASVWVDFPFPF